MFNIMFKISNTPAELAWCNGICEKNDNLINIILKALDKIYCQLETAIKCAINAKNSFKNICDFNLY